MSSSRHPTNEATRSSHWLAAANLPWPWAGLIGLALTAQLTLIWNHVPWADELQATALARESHTLADWYWNFRYEGHPPLWHLLLKIPLAFTDDPTALKIVQTIMVLCSAALLHLCAPFSPGVKFLLSLNYFLFFEYGVIARNYSLTVLFFFGAIAFRRRPMAWLFIALLPQGGLQSVMLAGICGLIILREQGWKWWGVLLAACGCVVALMWMWPAEDFESGYSLRIVTPFINRLAQAILMTGTTLAPVDYDLGLTGWENAREPLVVAAIGLAGPVYVIRRLAQKDYLLAALTALFVLTNMAIYIYIYFLSIRHAGLWIILAIGICWVTQKKGGNFPGTALVWVVALALSGLGVGIRQTMEPFSITMQTADALREAGGASELIIPVRVIYGAEVHGLLRVPTYDMAGGCLQTFVRWRKPIFMAPTGQEFTPQHAYEEYARRGLDEMKKVAARAGGRALLLLDLRVGGILSTIDDPALTFLRYITTASKSRQGSYLYRLDVPPDPNPVPIPACVH